MYKYLLPVVVGILVAGCARTEVTNEPEVSDMASEETMEATEALSNTKMILTCTGTG